MNCTTTAQFLRDTAAKVNKQMTWDELDSYLSEKIQEEANKGLYKVTIPFSEINAHTATIEEWQRIAKQPHNAYNVVIQTPNQVNKELMIKWG